MCKAIVILTPDSCSQENIQGCNLCTPFNLEGFLDPLAMLVNHRVDDVNEWRSY